MLYFVHFYHTRVTKSWQKFIVMKKRSICVKSLKVSVKKNYFRLLGENFIFFFTFIESFVIVLKLFVIFFYMSGVSGFGGGVTTGFNPIGECMETGEGSQHRQQ